ncbi:MAG: hypothetical protein HC835_12015 [Oscillatoriales cyanobacterium RM2_1_1]|nr:hypothetical protein [Oscillatoriales cyanobacterium RM2_1_1]
MTILVFGEGSTEEKVCKKVAELSGYQAQYISCGGTGQLNTTVINRISPLLQEQEPVYCIILRDLDAHMGETQTSIFQSISDALQRGLNAIGVQVDTPQMIQDSTHVNVYRLMMPDLKFRLAVHLATKRWHECFIKSTIDDYVLELALRQNTVIELAKKVSIPPDRLIAKITEEIPALLRSNANGIDDLTEAKDYVRLYAAVVKSATSPAVFAERTMAKAQEADICEIFQPLIAAFEFVGGA